jgi:hypothetical protein
MSETARVSLPSSRPPLRPLANPKRAPEVGPCSHVLRLAEANRVSTGEVLRLLGPDGVGFSHLVGDPPTLSAALRRLSARCRYCPRCLSRGESWHRGWETPCVDACPRCGCWLADECAACHRPVTWSRSRLMECACGASLTQGLGREAPEALVALARSMSSLEDAPKGQSPIAGLDPQRAAAVVWFLGRLAAGGASVRRAGPVELPPMWESWPVTSAAAEILADWPRAFCRVLDQCRDRCPEEDRGSLLRVFPEVYSTLYKHPRPQHFVAVLEAFEAYVIERWPGQLAKRHGRLEDRALGEPAWIRVRQAVRLTGYPESALRKLVSQGDLESQTWTTVRGRSFLLLRRTGVETLLAAHGPAIDLCEAAVRLGLSESRLAQVLPKVCLGALAPIRQGGRWTIPAKWVEEWEQLISDLPHETRTSGCLMVEDALRFFLSDSDAVVQLLNAIRDGEVVPVGRVQTVRGLSGILIRRAKFREWADSRRPQLDSLSIRAAAKLIGVKEEVAYYLARRGVLESTSTRVGRRVERRISERAIARFIESYVLAKTIAVRTGSSARAVQRFLSECGVTAVCGPGVDTCRQLVYRRHAVFEALSAHGLDAVQVCEHPIDA